MMPCPPIGVFTLISVLTASALAPQPGPASSHEGVREALEGMHRWVGDGGNGRRWKECLQSARLEKEIARGDRADPETLGEILQVYENETAGLDCPRFAAVHQALRAWLDAIDAPTASDLPALARRGKGRFVPVTPRWLARSRAQLARSVRRLDRYLTPGGENGRAWKAYLKWDVLQGQIGADVQPDPAALREIYRQFTSDQAGLELPVFSAVARDLRRYTGLVAVARTPAVTEQYARELGTLAAALESYAKEPTEQESRKIGQSLDWLQGSGQMSWLVHAVRRVFSHANLHIAVSARMLDAGMSRPVDRVDPLIDVILGTRVTGTTHTIGQVHIRLIPCHDKAILVSDLTGTTTSDTVGRNGPAVIYSDGQTRIRAAKRLILDEHGIEEMPASSHAVTSTSVRGIAIRSHCLSRLLEKIAWRRVHQSKSLAEAIAARHGEQNLNRRFDQHAADQITQANAQFASQFRNPLLRRHIFPQRFLASTSRDALRLELLQATQFQLAAATAAPELDGTYDLSLRVHESLINNLAASLLTGRTFTEAQVQKMATDLLGELPEQLQSAADEDPWSITFAHPQPPVTVEFADNGFKITIRGRRYTSGQQDFQAMNVTAVYKVKRTETGALLTRQGDLEILPPSFRPGKTRLNASQVALRRLLNRRLGELFKPEIVSHGLELSGEWKEVGKLELAQLDAENAWLTLGWNMPPIPKAAAREAGRAP